jgi:ribosomal protein S18 acetylase RimI-like enzyme
VGGAGLCRLAVVAGADLTRFPFEIRPITDPSPELALLADLALSEGIRNVSMLAEDFKAKRISSDDGVLILGAWQGTKLLGIGGRTRCPNVKGALRMRRFFVAPEARRLGIARAIAQMLLTDANKHCELVTCNARASDAAPLFWEALGFDRSDLDGLTHAFHLSARPIP